MKYLVIFFLFFFLGGCNSLPNFQDYEFIKLMEYDGHPGSPEAGIDIAFKHKTTHKEYFISIYADKSMKLVELPTLKEIRKHIEDNQ